MRLPDREVAAPEPSEDDKKEAIGFKRPEWACASCANFDGEGACSKFGFATDPESWCAEGFEEMK